MFYKTYRSGYDFEEAVLGCHSKGLNPLENWRPGDSNFSKVMKSIIRKSGRPYPDTRLGEVLYHLVRRRLENVHHRLNTRGMAFLGVTDSAADLQHQTDCLFYVPSLNHVVTIDIYNFDPTKFQICKDRWLDSFEGEIYTESNLQSDLYYWKRGWAIWRNSSSYDKEVDNFNSFDCRVFNDRPRPENHFVLTPYHTGSYKNRRGFASMVAEHFIQVFRCQKAEKREAKSPICA